MVLSPELNAGLGVYGGGSSSGIPSRSRSGGILLVSFGGGEETVTEGGGGWDCVTSLPNVLVADDRSSLVPPEEVPLGVD
jgi:hypothetical protein